MSTSTKYNKKTEKSATPKQKKRNHDKRCYERQNQKIR